MSREMSIPTSKRDLVLWHAFTLFLQKGYDGTSMSDIVNTSGISKGAIYHHFKSKREVYYAAWDEYYFAKMSQFGQDDAALSFVERVRARYEVATDIFDFVERGLAERIDFPIRAYFTFSLESEKDAVIYDRLLDFLKTYRQEVTQMVEAAMRKGEIPDTISAEVIAYQLMSMSEGMSIHFSSVRTDCKEFLMREFDKTLLPYLQMITVKE